ncbi:hypothetical protein [Niveibacterium sp. SC-1]|uniref:hypothetical protein n=1 Tax=Niveibacterium sp. SC-1 TaxID=3135646 RepID=UPI00311ECA17
MSTSWTRFAGLCPSLRPRLQVSVQRHRGHTEYVLHDPVSSHSLRLSSLAYRFVSRLNGHQSVARIAELVAAEAPQVSPGHELLPEQVADLLGLLRSHDLVERWGDDAVDELFSGMRPAAPMPAARRNPLYLQIPLFDAAPVVERIYQRLRPLWGPAIAWVWLALVILAALLALRWASELADYARVKASQRGFLVLTWLAYPLLKFTHELAHGLMLRHLGGRPGRLGLSLIVLTPVPHLDASDSARFASRRHRALVAAAGIACELAWAALALLGWLLLPEGWLREACLAVMLIGGVSTLLVNGNPLLRYDGYYLFSDLLDLPNLASRAQQLRRQWLERHLLGLAPAHVVPMVQGEYGWLLAYAIASPLYRVLLLGTMVFVLAAHWPGLAALFALLMLAGVSRSWWRVWRSFATQPRYASVARRARAGWALLPLLLLAGLAFLPLPQGAETLGVLSLPEQMLVRAGQSGLVADQPVRDGSAVKAGTVLVRLSNPERVLARERAEQALIRARSRELAALQGQASQAAAQRAAREQAELDMKRASDDETALDVVASQEGHIRLWGDADWAGRWVKRGELLGWVEQPGSVPRVVFLLPAEVLSEWSRQVDSLRVLPGHSAAALPVSHLRVTPQAVDRLPFERLDQRNGGPFATDPAHPDDAIPLQPLFRVEADCPGLPLLQGQGVGVTLKLQPRPLIPRLWQALQRRWREGQSQR